MDNNKQKPSHDVPFDHDLDDFDVQFQDDTVPSEEESLEEVRGVSELEKDRKIKQKGQKALLVCLMLAAILISAGLFYKIFLGKKTTEKKEEPKASFEKPPERSFGQQFAESQPASTIVEDGTQVEPISNHSVQTNTSGVVGHYPSTTVEPPRRYDDEPVSRVAAPTEPAFSRTQSNIIEPPHQVSTEPPTMIAPMISPEEERLQRLYKSGFNFSQSGASKATVQGQKPPVDPLVASLTPATLDGSSASRLKDRDFIITKGNMIDCVLDTKFDSTVVGMVTCSVTRNIYGASGRVVLIDRGSKVTGEYKGGLQQGQNRVFIVWNRIETPKGVIINVNSPSAGSLGESGVDGRIDSKFMKRFGGAMLVSLVNDLGKAVSEAAAEKAIGGNVRLEDSTNTAQQMASAELEKSINIPPSLIKHQGDRLNVYVARDLYFGGVYALKNR